MVIYKSSEEIEIIKQNCLLVSKTLALVASIIKPGITGVYVDKLAEEFILDNDSLPGFKGYGNFPNTLCISLNDAVVHGIPSDREFRDGDVVSVDCGVLANGYYGDSAFTFLVGEADESLKSLLDVTNGSLYKGIESAVLGARLGDIGYAIQNHVVPFGFGIVRELVGHGIGKNLHEKPQVPNYGKRGQGQKLQEGLVIAIEPMINLGSRKIVTSSDGWTIKTKDGSFSAHFEHTIAITDSGPVILSDHSYIFDSIKKNQNILDFSEKC